MPGITADTGLKIVYTPSGTGAVAHTFLANGTVHSQTPSTYSGFHTTDKATVVTRGGKSQSQVFNLWWEFTLGVLNVHPEVHPKMWSELANFWAHASVGGQFEIDFTRERSNALTMNGAHSQGDTVILVNEDPSAIPRLFKQGDIVLIEHLTDRLQIEYHVLLTDGTTSPSNRISVNIGLLRDYATATTIRDVEAFNKCIASSNVPPFRRRRAAAGGGWDFSMPFRTVRN